MQLEPSVPSFRFLSALMERLRKRNANKEAIATLRDAIANAGADPIIHARLANALQKSGDLVGAEAAFRAAAKLDPNNEGRRYALARILIRVGWHQESFAMLCELVAAGAGSRGVLAEFNRQLVKYGGLTGAEKELRNVLRFNPHEAVFVGALAEVLDRQGRSDEALGVLLSFATEGTRHADIYARIGHLRASRGNLAGAAEALRKAIEIEPAVTRFQNSLAHVLDRQASLTGSEFVVSKAYESQ